jgi:murein L,D-transpeptidase YafK
MIAMNQGPVRRLVVALGIAVGTGPAALTAQPVDGADFSAMPLGTPIRLSAAEGTVRPAASRRVTFLDRQLVHPRVRRAHERKGDRVATLFRGRGLRQVSEIFFRVFKRDRVLEVWARDIDDDTFTLVESYPVCAVSGRLGPKRREGDLQVPEGFYTIDVFNPRSRYHLSMRVNYPNPVDLARVRGPSPGGDIYIHGGCATIGCVPVTDEKVEELYLMAARARAAGQRRIPVHIFPTRLDDAGLRWLGQHYGRRSVDFRFWENLQEGYLAFERTHRVPDIGYDGGRYRVRVPSLPMGTPIDQADAPDRVRHGVPDPARAEHDLTSTLLRPSVPLDWRTIPR